ncbi:hypothetical protein [Kordiimonas gwangyangensis]|nr:hypothetical protein [Kordiimonas gwangyangensis]
MAAASLAAVVLAAPAQADVDVKFEGYVADKMDAITRIDKSREKVFRRFREEGSRTQVRASDTLNRSYFSGTEWANERIFPDFSNYNVPDLIKGMMERGIKEADPDFAGTVEVTVDKIRVKDFSLAVVSATTTQMGGKVRVLDAAGNVVAEHDVWAGIVPEYSASTNYNGRNYAYLESAADTRIGPIVAEFTEKALETLYPNYDAPGLVLIHPRRM